MKKILFVLSAFALLGLTSCVDRLDNNPNFDPETNTVNTKFVVNIAAANEVKTKQTAAVAQRPGTSFRGLDNASLFSFSRASSYDGKPIAALDEVSTATAVQTNVPQGYFDLSTMITKDDLSLSDNGTDSRRILQISLPMKTNGLLFYGKAAQDNPRTGLTAADEYGAIYSDPVSETTPMAVIGSNLVSRLGSNRAALIQIEDMLEAFLHGLVNCGVNGNKVWNDFEISTVVKVGANGREYDFSSSPAQINWKDYLACVDDDNPRSPVPQSFDSDAPAVRPSPLEVILGNTYKEFTTFGTNEIRAGSARAIFRLVDDISAICKDGLTSSATSSEEWIAQRVMIQIMQYVAEFTNAVVNIASASDIEITTPTRWKATDLIHSFVKTNFPSTEYNYASAPASDFTVADFPFCFGLPQGSVVLRRLADNADNKVFKYYLDDIDISGMGRPNLTMSISDYCYPMELLYYGNSPVRVNNATGLTENDYGNGAGINGGWENNETFWGGKGWVTGSNAHVESSTRGVAMEYNIQYGVALLETEVKYSAAVQQSGKMYDNNDGIHADEDPHEIEVDGESFRLTGILVGGQPNEVGWNYLSKQAGDEHFTKMIYDRALTTYEGTDKYYYTEIPATGASAKNYTIVYDNYSMAQDPSDQYVVYVALEFRNKSGKDFWGLGNMIRNDGTFYLIGELTPYASENTLKTLTSWPKSTGDNKSKQIVPPYKVEGGVVKSTETTRVFIQDFMTSASFTLGSNSLKYAYVTVPDLKASKVSLGISVDLNWLPGLQFEDVILGGN